MLRRAVQTTRGRLALLLTGVGAVILVTAALAHLVFDQFPTYDQALWSATLHLLDPSSLHDDEGAAERTIGVFQVVTGLVLLVGVLFTLVAETVGRSIERLGTVEPPVRAKDHLVIVGGADMLDVAAGALELAIEIGERRPRVVVLAAESFRPSRRRLLDELRDKARELRVDLVFGNPADGSGFQRAAAHEAATVVLLPITSGPIIAEAADVEVMQNGLALKDYLEDRHADPQVRMLFRRGRHVDAIWDTFPSSWDAVVGDRIVTAILRTALTAPLADTPELDSLVDPAGGGDKGLLQAARDRARAEGRRLRLTIVGCGITTPALMEDLAQAGAERFEVTMLAGRASFEAHLGREDPAGLALRYRETPLADPELLGRRLGAADPDVVLVTPSPRGGDLRLSDAEATLTLLHTLQASGVRTPVLAELFLPESVDRLPPDRRLLPISVLRAVAAALALTIFDPERSEALTQRLEGAAQRT